MITANALQGLRHTGRVLVQDEGFAYLSPHPGLRGWISNYTVSFPGMYTMSDGYSVLPHGSVTLVAGWDGNHLKSNLFGPITKPACVGQAANRLKMLFIVEFQPAGYYAFSGMPQKELTDLVLPFGDVHAPLNRLIQEKLASASDIGCLVSDIDRLFFAHLKTEYYRQAFSLANQMILQNGGACSVQEISKSVFYSERQLHRVFDEYLGVGVKTFSRLVRVNRAIRLVRRRDYSLTQAYMETGFYDMPHFLRDFKAICGVTPQQYRENMSDFYSEIAKFSDTM
jgi:AraC-like DNA-binding protein